jgi:thymidine kinase
MRKPATFQTRTNAGSLTVICGSMFSGKTEELIRLVRRAMHARKRVQVFKSSLETRCETTMISTHDGTTFTAHSTCNSAELERLLEPDVQVVGIEEVQFFDEGIVPLVLKLADQGVHVIVAGLDQDFRGQPFSFMPQLMALADDVMKLHAICKVCGAEASRTQRLVDGRPASWDEPIILIGAEESYEARCRRCHVVRKAPKPAAKSAQNSSMQTRPLANKSRAKTSKNGNGKHDKHAADEPTISVCVDDGTQLDMFPEISS